MIITEEVAKELNLSPEQVTAINTKSDTYIADQKKEWDGKANENAEKILSGAAEYLQTKTGVKEARQQGEKYGDYLTRISDKVFESKKTEIEAAKAEYDKKLKEFKGDEATKAELDKAKADLDAAKQQLADYDSLKEKAGKYDETAQSLTDYKRKAAFGSVKPTFNKDANQYEINAKWGDFQKRVEEKYNIEIVDENYIAIDKENNYKQVKLSELVEKDDELKTIVGERVIPGVKSSGKSLKIEGFEVEVTEEAKTDVKKRTEIVQQQIAKKHPSVSKTSTEYTELFKKYSKEITESK